MAGAPPEPCELGYFWGMGGTLQGMITPEVGYDFLAAKPAIAGVMDFLSPWPWYIPELAGIGILSLLVYYTPFWVMVSWRRRT